MAQRAADNPGMQDDHGIIELDEDDFVFDEPEEPINENSAHGAPPERKSAVRLRINTTNYIHINPSSNGWTVRLDMGDSVDEEFRGDIEQLKQLRNLGVFTIRFEKFGKRLIAVIQHSEYYEADRFEGAHLSLFGKDRYQVVTSAPPHCLRVPSGGESVDRVRIEVYEKARKSMNEQIPQKIPILEYYKFDRFTIYMSEKNWDKERDKLQLIAGVEGLSMQEVKEGRYIRKIIFTKNAEHPSQMLEHNHAIVLAFFNPEID